MLDDVGATILWWVLKIIFWPVFFLARVWFDLGFLILDGPIGERWVKKRPERDEPLTLSRVARFIVGLVLYFTSMLVIGLLLTVAFWMGWLPWWAVFGLVILTGLLFFTATVLSTFGLMVGGATDPRLQMPKHPTAVPPPEGASPPAA